MKELSYLNKYFFKYKYRFILGVVFVAASNLFGVIAPRVVRHAVDLVSENRDLYYSLAGSPGQAEMRSMFFKVLLIFGAIFLGLAIIRGIFMFFMRQTVIVMSRLIEYDLKNELYEQYQRLDQAFYKRNNTGDLMSRVAEDVSRVRMYVGPGLMYTINMIVLFVLVIYTMVSINPTLTMYVLLPLPILSVSIYYVNTIINRKSEAIQRQLSLLTSLSQEVFSGIRVIKAYVQEKPIGSYFDKECEDYKTKSLELSKVEALFHPLMLLLIGLSTIITIYIGGMQVIAGRISPGNVAEFVIYVNMLTWPVASLGWVASIIQRASASQKRINEFLLAEPAIPVDETVGERMQGKVEFRKVSFTYPDTGIQALRDVSFTLTKGQKVAILGRTGSGKSSLAELLVRMYDPDQGEILLDDQNIKTLTTGHLRSQIGYVPQDVFLFSESVAYNIQFGQPLESMQEDKARQLATYASIANEIEQFPEAFNTLVGERGVTLSGGQKQRISIARAFAKDAPVLLLDDCLSAVDAKTEQTILTNLGEYLQNRTAIIITHRIFSLLDFDSILVLDKGTIAEQGTHAELMSMKGLYFDLYEKQKQEEQVLKG